MRPSNRQIYSSLAKHFSDSLSSLAHVHIEGFDRRTEGKEKWFEFRCDGPKIYEPAKGTPRLVLEVNISCIVAGIGNAYTIHDMTSLATDAFVYSIPIIGTNHYATLMPEEKEKVHVAFFGKIRPDTEIIQASVEGHYRILA